MGFLGRVRSLPCGSRLVLLVLALQHNVPLVRGLAASGSNNNNNNNSRQPTQTKVAIIGGGVAGLSCAQHLSESAQFDVTVFDTGRLRPGGRLSSRLPTDTVKEGSTLPKYHYLSKCIIDHAAQILPLPPDEADSTFQNFGEQLLHWEKQGVVLRFPEKSLCNIAETQGKDNRAFQLQPLVSSSNDDSLLPVFHGANGNGGIPMAMARNANFKVVQDTWVSPGNGARYINKSRKWKISASGKVLGYFHKIIIAHNGKCADRLMSKSPAKQVHRLLRVNFNSNAKDGAQKMTLNSIYSLTFAIPSDSDLSQKALKEPFIAGYIQNEHCLRFVSCQSRKYPASELASENVDVWTVLSSATFAKKHKAPQEFIPEEKAAEVTSLLLQGLERSLGLESDSIRPLESRLQLWGAAVPLNTWKSSSSSPTSSGTNGFLYDPAFGVGVCGDWLLQPSVAGAWTSGRRLADHIRTNPTTEIGLENGTFVRSEGSHKGGIASLESFETAHKAAKVL